MASSKSVLNEIRQRFDPNSDILLENTIMRWNHGTRYGPIDSLSEKDGKLTITSKWYINISSVGAPDISPAKFDETERTVVMNCDQVTVVIQGEHILLMTEDHGTVQIRSVINQRKEQEAEATMVFRMKSYWQAWFKKFCWQRVHLKPQEWELHFSQPGEIEKQIPVQIWAVDITIQDRFCFWIGVKTIIQLPPLAELIFLVEVEDQITTQFSNGNIFTFFQRYTTIVANLSDQGGHKGLLH